VYNVGCNAQTTLNELHTMLCGKVARFNGAVEDFEPVYRSFRAGDMRHSRANVEKAKRLLGYRPTHDVDAGLKKTVEWYAQQQKHATPHSP